MKQNEQEDVAIGGSEKTTGNTSPAQFKVSEKEVENQEKIAI